MKEKKFVKIKKLTPDDIADFFLIIVIGVIIVGFILGALIF